jgi:hypothetical protein
MAKLFVALLLIVLATASVAVYGIAPVRAGVGLTTNSGFNRAGNILITDQFNNRVIEIDQAGKL